MSSTVTPISDTARVLSETSSEALLDAIVRLTHIIHTAVLGSEYAANLREQRALLRGEVLARIGGNR